MKKLRTKTISVLLCLSLFANIPSVFAQGDTENDHLELSEGEIASLAQTAAVSAYEAIYDAIVYTDSNGITGHHEDYGGCYINDENMLVVCVKNGTTELQDVLSAILEDDAPVVYEYCDWTIEEAKNELNKIVSSLPEDKIESMYYSSKRNAFVFSVSEEDSDSITQLWQTKARTADNIPPPFEVDIIAANNMEASTMEPSMNESTAATEEVAPYAVTTIRSGDPLYGYKSDAGLEHYSQERLLPQKRTTDKTQKSKHSPYLYIRYPFKTQFCDKNFLKKRS